LVSKEIGLKPSLVIALLENVVWGLRAEVIADGGDEKVQPAVVVKVAPNARHRALRL